MPTTTARGIELKGGADTPTSSRNMLSVLAKLESPQSPTGQELARAEPDRTVAPRTERATSNDRLPPWITPRITLWCLGAAVLIGLAVIIFGNNITRFFLLLVAACMISGYWLGASKMAATFGGLLLGALIGVPLGKAFEGVFAVVAGTTGLTNRMISTAVVAMLTAAVSAVALRLVVDRTGGRWPAWKRYDRLAGSGFGVLEGMLLGFIVIWTVQWLEPIARNSTNVSENVPTGTPFGERAANPAANLIVTLAENTRDSIVGQAAGAMNPLQNLRLLTLIHKFLVILNDPIARQAFAFHPSIQEITTYESVQQAISMMECDPQLRPIIESDGVSREDIYTIMSNQTVLKILDETSLLDDLTPLANEIEKAIEAAVLTVDSDPPVTGQDGK